MTPQSTDWCDKIEAECLDGETWTVRARTSARAWVGMGVSLEGETFDGSGKTFEEAVLNARSKAYERAAGRSARWSR